MRVSRPLGRLSLFDCTSRVRARLHRFLLMLALPAQALAYSAMQACTVANRGAAEPMATSGETMAMAGCHAPDQPHSAPVQHECKYCAACALASALPIEFAGSTPVVPIARSFALPPAASFSGFIPDGPERPLESRSPESRAGSGA